MLLKFTSKNGEEVIFTWINPQHVRRVRPVYKQPNKTFLQLGEEDGAIVDGIAEEVAHFIAKSMAGVGARCDEDGYLEIPEFVPLPTGPDLEGSEFAPDGA